MKEDKNLTENKRLIDLKPMGGGECIAGYQNTPVISLLCIENLLNEHGNVRTRVCTKIIIPTNLSSPFWILVCEIAKKQGLNDVVTAVDYYKSKIE